MIRQETVDEILIEMARPAGRTLPYPAAEIVKEWRFRLLHAYACEKDALRADTPPAENARLVNELDALLAAQARLLFAKENYNADEAEEFGIRVLDFLRKEGLAIRAALVRSNTELTRAGTASG